MEVPPVKIYRGDGSEPTPKNWLRPTVICSACGLRKAWKPCEHCYTVMRGLRPGGDRESALAYIAAAYQKDAADPDSPWYDDKPTLPPKETT